MLGIDARAARAAWTVFLLALAIAAAYRIRETLVVFMIALLFAYLLSPLVGLIERFTPRWVSPRIALVIVYLCLIGAISGICFTLGSSLVDEANSLAAQLPDLLKSRSWLQSMPLPDWLAPARGRIEQWVQDQVNQGGQQFLPYVRSFGGQLLSGARYVVYAVLVPILSFFFLKDGRTIREGIVSCLANDRRQLVVDEILEDINRLLGQYIRALVLLAVSSFVAVSIFLGISGAPYAMLLALAAALGEFLPVVGPAGAMVVTIVVAGLAGYSHLLAYFLFWVLFRLFQDYVASPFLMGRGVELNPMLVLFGLLAGEQIAGVVGMFFSVPVIATARVVLIRLQRARTREYISPRD
jgi:predicted PurR-regulated permease PerM